MEVQKHPHHVMHKKKLGEYLLEFFMLFLAVFLGFVAENVRERTNQRNQKGNIIRQSSSTGEQQEYRLLKSEDGHWIHQDVPGFDVGPDDAMTSSIKKAIDSYETHH